MDTNYGRLLREYLSHRVTLRRVHRFDASDVQFDDALVTSAVVVLQNRPPRPSDLTEFSFGGSVVEPRDRTLIETTSLNPREKWISYFNGGRQQLERKGPVIADFFRIRRGIATGANNFFIISKDEASDRGIRPESLKPVLPGPRHIRDLVVEADADGYAELEKKLALINCTIPEALLIQADPALASYLADAPAAVKEGYLVRSRNPWYRQEQRDPSPFICTYMGRGIDEMKPFRFIMNRSLAVATNLFLMLYPIGTLARYLKDHPERLDAVHQALLSLTAADLRNGGRVYGGGLHKLEPKELAALSAQPIVEVAPELLDGRTGEQLTLLGT